MAKIDKLEDRRKADRLTAQLGLAAAEQQEVSGACLTPDQLVDVATSHCSPEERRAALAHFSSCRKCYDAWVGVSLSLVAMESGLERRKRPLLSLRNMGYLGSAVAIAASVVVFFNLQGDLIRTVTLPGETAVEQAVPSDAAQPELRMRVKKEAATSQPAAAPPMETRQKDTRMELQPEKTVETKAGENGAAAIPQAASPAQEMTDQAASGLEAERLATAAEWLSGLAGFCREKGYRGHPEEWNRMLAEGQMLTKGGTESDFSRKIASILPIMVESSDMTAIETQCGAILPLLAGADKKE